MSDSNPASNEADQCAKAREILFAWAKANNTADLATVSTLYADNAVLFPTFSRTSAQTPETVQDYFIRLGKNENFGVTLHEKTIRIRPVGPEHCVVSGLYRFFFDVDGETMSFEARFTMLVSPGQPRPILHHHSSAIPRGF